MSPVAWKSPPLREPPVEAQNAIDAVSGGWPGIGAAAASCRSCSRWSRSPATTGYGWAGQLGRIEKSLAPAGTRRRVESARKTNRSHKLSSPSAWPARMPGPRPQDAATRVACAAVAAAAMTRAIRVWLRMSASDPSLLPCGGAGASFSRPPIARSPLRDPSSSAGQSGLSGDCQNRLA